MTDILPFSWLLFAVIYIAVGVKGVFVAADAEAWLFDKNTKWFYPVAVILWWPIVVIAYAIEGWKRWRY